MGRVRQHLSGVDGKGIWSLYGCVWLNRITIKLQLPGKSRLIFKFYFVTTATGIPWDFKARQSHEVTMKGLIEGPCNSYQLVKHNLCKYLWLDYNSHNIRVQKELKLMYQQYNRINIVHWKDSPNPFLKVS